MIILIDFKSNDRRLYGLPRRSRLTVEMSRQYDIVCRLKYNVEHNALFVLNFYLS